MTKKTPREEKGNKSHCGVTAKWSEASSQDVGRTDLEAYEKRGKGAAGRRQAKSTARTGK